jgi:hypothetical protein
VAINIEQLLKEADQIVAAEAFKQLNRWIR